MIQRKTHSPFSSNSQITNKLPYEPIMMRMNLFLLAVCVFGASSADAFVVSSQHAARTSATTTSLAAVTRKSFLQDCVAVGVAAATTLAVPGAARADVTSKVASSSALRTVKSSQKRMEGLAEAVELNDYAAVMATFREAPFSDIRKSCTTLIKGGEDGPDAEKLADQYKSFVTAIEKLDSTASVAVRGKKLREGEFSKVYSESVAALGVFVTTAQESVTIPIQES